MFILRVCSYMQYVHILHQVENKPACGQISSHLTQGNLTTTKTKSTWRRRVKLLKISGFCCRYLKLFDISYLLSWNRRKCVEKCHKAGSYLIFVTNSTNTFVEKICHVEEFQISIHGKCSAFSDLSTWQM